MFNSSLIYVNLLILWFHVTKVQDLPQQYYEGTYITSLFLFGYHRLRLIFCSLHTFFFVNEHNEF